jgi:ATP-binding cassette subfamily C protein LapB
LTEQPVSEKQNQPLGKIEPIKVAASEVGKASKIEDAEVVSPKAASDNTAEHEAALIDAEAALIDATVVLLREFGIRKSRAAVRDAVEMPHEIFAPSQSVSALSMLGFKASFGSMALKKMTEDFFPLIAFKSNGNSVVIKTMPVDGQVKLASSDRKKPEIIISLDDFTDEFNGFVILVKELNKREKEDRSGHWFFGAFRKSKWLYTQVAIAAMVSNFLSLTTSLFTMTVYDRVIPNGAFESLLALSIGVVIALGFDFLIKSLRANFIDKASKRADIEISRRLFDRILSLSPSEQRQRTGAMAGTIREFETLREFFNSSTLVILIDLPFVFFFIYVISLIAGPLAYIPLISVPLVIIVGLGMQPFLSRITRGTMESGMNKQAVLVETLNGLETVNATGSGKLMKKRYEDALHNQSDSGNKLRALTMFIINFAASVQQYAQVALIFYGVYLIVDGTITQGALIGAVILGGRTMAPLSQLANALSRVNGALTSYRHLSKLIGTSFNSAANLSPISRPDLVGEIEFKGVSYKYEEASQPIIHNLSFKIPAGQKVALVGKMGSGKSTLSRLVAGIYRPTQGSILIDGVDVRQIDPADIRKNIGMMLQDSWLFSGTVRENIQMGFHEYDDQHVLEICKIAGVDDFVGSHPKGYDLEIQERGVGLSGGQKQAINLARSLLHDPKVLLLDEPTSSMDQGSEKKVVDSLQEVCVDKTMLIVTHRNPILQMVDRVLILENGQIVADKTPEELGMKKG